MTTFPTRIERLPELSRNLLWSWNPTAPRLFARLDERLWEETEHNPVRLLEETENLDAAAEDPEFLALYDRAVGEFDSYRSSPSTWTLENHPEVAGAGVAYFSAEFGLHESLPIYSGGLGVLAGDHVKSASDLGLPLTGVGILYSEGFFRQRLDGEGRQSEVYETLDLKTLPVRPALDANGDEAYVNVELPGGVLRLKVWRVEVGRVALVLLDADVEENSEEDRRLTSRLYGDGQRMRISQEIILGVGGVRALRRLGLSPSVFHMNEGHAAFLSLERMRELVKNGDSFESAREKVKNSTVFTTHTPVPAGHDAFDGELFWNFLSGWPEELSASEDELWSLGVKEGDGRFNMTALAMNLSAKTNAVSEIHGEVSREMWGREISHITNGVHTFSWLSPRLQDLFENHSPTDDWRKSPEKIRSWDFAREIPAAELWSAHMEAKREMVRALNSRLERQNARSGREVNESSLLDPDALIIGFARRFATYKRATLLLSDPERLRRITGDASRGASRPVQFVFAGKAHPADEPGKEFIRALKSSAVELDLPNVIVLEDYDMNVARHLVRGADVWMNNPRRPLEASGTSGQKAAINGVPNFSVLDGWWPEAYNAKNGWAIGEEKEFASEEEQDAADVQSLYRTLEEEIVPLYYDRADGVPDAWVEVMKEAIVTVAPAFSTQRMVQDYVRELYAPSGLVGIL